MKTDPKTTIKSRLMNSMLLASLLPALIGGLAFVAYDLMAERSVLIQKQDALTQGLALECRAPLAVREQAKLAKVLAGLDAKSNIFAAYVYAKDADTPLAAYEKPGVRVSRPSPGHVNNPGFSFFRSLAFASTVGPSEYHFTLDSLSMQVPITNDGHVIGRLQVISDLRDIYSVFHKYVVIGPLVVAACLIIWLIFTSVLIRSISVPIQNLADSINHISVQKDYFKRLKVFGAGELRAISEGFNEVMDHIMVLDARLDSKDEHLKHEFAAQASELAKSKKCLAQTMMELKRLKDAAGGANQTAPKPAGAAISSADNGRERPSPVVAEAAAVCLPNNGGRAECLPGIDNPEAAAQEDIPMLS